MSGSGWIGLLARSKVTGTRKAHLISVLGGDSDIGAIWAAVVEQNQFTVEAPGMETAHRQPGRRRPVFSWNDHNHRSQTYTSSGRHLG